MEKKKKKICKAGSHNVVRQHSLAGIYNKESFLFSTLNGNKWPASRAVILVTRGQPRNRTGSWKRVRHCVDTLKKREISFLFWQSTHDSSVY